MVKQDAPINEVAGYKLAACIGAGGMGSVYKAYNSSLNRWAAVKILQQKDLSERFRNEANIQSSVNHPNIARLYEFAICEGHPCIVMEYIEGETLDSLMKRKGKLTSAEAQSITLQIVTALCYLHKKGIIHRDIKPQNFKIQPDGTVKMLDFGIAKTRYSPKLTQQGFIVGTLEYLAPEQYQFHQTVQSDIWALAVMLYEMVTGFLPFEASNPVTLRTKIIKGNFTDPRILIPEISEPLRTIIHKGLQINPENRMNAEAIKMLLGKRQRKTGTWKLDHRQFKWNIAGKNQWMLPVVGLLLLLLIFLWINSGNPNNSNNNNIYDTIVNNNRQVLQDPTIIAERRITISTPGIENAELILPDSAHLPLPYEVKGKLGDFFKFTIRAPGYADKSIDVVITSHRSSYEYNLDKINN